MNINIPLKTRPLFPEGEYLAKITDMELARNKYNDKDQIRIKFELIEFRFEDQPDFQPDIF